MGPNVSGCLADPAGPDLGVDVTGYHPTVTVRAWVVPTGLF